MPKGQKTRTGHHNNYIRICYVKPAVNYILVERSISGSTNSNAYLRFYGVHGEISTFFFEQSLGGHIDRGLTQ